MTNITWYDLFIFSFQDDLSLNTKTMIYLIDSDQPAKLDTRVMNPSEFNKFLFLNSFLFNYIITKKKDCSKATELNLKKL